MFIKKINNKIFFNKSGFTLIEIIITMGIIALLSATMFRIVSVSETNHGLIMAGDKVKSSIRLAQSYALSVPQEVEQRTICGYGIHVDGTSIIRLYHLYNNDFEANPEACNDSSALDYSGSASLFKVDDIAIDLGQGYLATGSQLFLKTPYGEVYSDNNKLTGNAVGTLIINKDSRIMNVNINGAGQVSF